MQLFQTNILNIETFLITNIFVFFYSVYFTSKKVHIYPIKRNSKNDKFLWIEISFTENKAHCKLVF